MIGNAETIKELKAAILAIEWEINDEAIDDLLRALEPLNRQWAGKKPLLVCLQVIGTLGQYIKKAKEKAHPEAVKLLPSVFSTLEKVVIDPAVDEKQMVAMVRAEVEKYNKLKGELAKHRGEQKTVSPVGPTPSEMRPEAKIPSPPAPVSPVVPQQREEVAVGGGGSTIRDLMDQKEDKAVDGAFGAIFQEMVSDTQKPAPPAPARGGMPSSTHQPKEGDKEFIPDRIDGEVFQEADDLLDDFFSDDNLSLSIGESTGADVDLEEETVQVDVGRISAVKDEAAKEVEIVEEEEVELANLERIIREIRKHPTDFLFKNLSDELDALRSQYPNHSSMGLFLQCMGSLGRHMAQHKDIARERSSAMLQEIYDRLVHSLFTMQSQQNILAAHQKTLSDYISWHEKVVGEIEQAVVSRTIVEVESTDYDLPPEMLSAVKRLVKDEMEKLRQELLMAS